MKRKGFTLIELLAVIVILAIIALIAIPVITNVIEKARKGAAESSALGYIKAVENQVAINAVDTSKEDIVDKEYDISELSSKGVSVKGNGPTSGNVKIEKGQVTACSLVIDKYTVTCLGNGKVQVGEEEKEKLEGTEISVVAQSLLDNNTTYGNYTYMNGTYLKGEQDNNYVWYNGFLWRIMGINENGTVRLITEENVGTVPYGSSGEGLLYETNEGYINDWLNDYFLDNLDSSKTDIITNSEWCLNTTTDSTSARQTCEGGTTFSANVGLITIDEYNLSGASLKNSTYYLVNSQYYWTLTPYSTSYAWSMYSLGKAFYNGVAGTYGVRPVINVRTDAVITGGNGSLSDAYILNQTSETKTGKLNEKASSGEYVSLDKKIYRVVNKEANGTKLIYDGYYEEPLGTIYTMTYGNNNTFTVLSGIGQKLNGDVLTWLGNSNKIIETNWYQGSELNYGTKYTSILEDTTSPIQAKVGLIRLGEMLSGQSASILTKSTYWTMNKYTSNAWYVLDIGNAANIDVASTNGVRPVIVVSTDTTISSGNGTLQSPYIIE